MIQINSLHFRYPSSSLGEVLKDISFKIEPHEIVGVLGPNGSGKTTLLKILARLLSPTAGQIFLQETELSKFARRELSRKIAFVPQEEELFLPFTVEQIVLMGRAPYVGWIGFESEEDRHQADEAMKATHIWAMRDRDIRELSGGERQRVFIARALAQKAPILILDEPTTHLDIHYQVEILELLSTLNHHTIIMSLHDLNFASLYCSKILLLKEGKVFGFGKPKEVLTQEAVRMVYGENLKVELRDDSKPYFLPVRRAV